MSSALGILRWTPEVFWKGTFFEYTAAMKGLMVSKGVKVVEPMTRNEFLALKRADEARRKRGT